MKNHLSSVSVIGLGYIGLPTAGVLAAKGFDVFGCDVNPQVVNTINAGHAHIIEHDLEQLIHQVVVQGKLSCSITPKPANVFIISVPTPFTDGYAPDLTYIKAATKSIAPLLQAHNLVILESTSPVGTTEQLAAWLAEERPDLNIPLGQERRAGSGDKKLYIAHCPERVLPGRIIEELIKNDRIIGGLDADSALCAESFYQKFVTGGVLVTDAATAELVKLTENAFRDVNIAFANELSLICDKLKINVWELIRLANRHPRVNILQPGPGVGGHCIAVDPWFVVYSAPKEAKLIRTAREVNDHKPDHVLNQIKSKAKQFENPVIACLGLSYKANIDDLRESPSLHIVEKLANDSIGQLLIVEPHIKELPQSLSNKNLITLSDYPTAIEKADIIVLLVAHNEFLSLDHNVLPSKTVIDTVGVWLS